MQNVTLKPLRIFASVANQLSFTRAAQSLFLTQPAVSSQIAQLEQAISSRLFDRIGRSVRVTEAGKQLMKAADQIDRILESTSQSLEALRGVKTGTLKVGAVDTANYFAASLVNAFGAQHPAINIRYTVDKTRTILSQLVEGQTDVVIISRQPSDVEAVGEPFSQHPYVIIAPLEHRLAKASNIPLKRLLKERFVTRAPGALARTIMDEMARDAGMDYLIEMETNSNERIKQAVMAGIGIGCVSGYTLSMELLTRRLVTLKVKGFPVIKHWHIIHMRDRQLSPAGGEHPTRNAHSLRGAS